MSIVQPDSNAQSPFSLYKYRFTPNTAGIFPGLPIIDLEPEDVLYGAFITVDEAWNGTTPHADIGFSEAGGTTIFTTLGTGAVSLAAASAAYGGAIKSIQNLTAPLLLDPLAVVPSTSVVDPGAPSDTQPSRELYLCVSTTGAPTGAATASTQGSATVFIVVAEAIDISIADTELAG